MIEEFTKRWPEIESALLTKYQAEHPESYQSIFRDVVERLGGERGSPDPERIHVIDDGEYQGTLLFVVAAQGYQPSDYWACKVNYGSCSGCDTFEAIRGYSSDKPSEDQSRDYVQLALHMLQGLREVGE